ncbi:hypothetical protein EYF80_061653 [Liparis tanakae]|uniref:Uncharacterized protein n=1 Tax=Liparis tanakae TaxID=230148 RepID=A0A4Z2EH46_9TELE|nr:hypothetical protein EYF80_061653 [Liparis tanakae]
MNGTSQSGRVWSHGMNTAPLCQTAALRPCGCLECLQLGPSQEHKAETHKPDTATLSLQLVQRSTFTEAWLETNSTTICTLLIQGA